MLTIRLQRLGKKNYSTYRFIISEKSRTTRGTYLELLGNYDPHKKEAPFALKEDRIKYWLGVGAQTSNTVHNLLLKAGVLTGTKRKKSVYISKKRATELAGSKKDAAPAVTPAPEPPKDDADVDSQA